MERSIAELQEKVDSLLAESRFDDLRVLLSEGHPSDLADIVNHIGEGDKAALFRLIPRELSPEVLSRVKDSTLTALLAGLDDEEISSAVDQLRTDDAADIVAQLSEDDANRVMDLMEDEGKESLQTLLTYPEESAGGLMESEFVAVHENVTVGEAVHELRLRARDVEQVRNVYAIDREGRLVGILELWRLTISPDDHRVEPLIDREFYSVPVDMDQEQVASLAMRYDLVEVPVVDAAGILVGRITLDDVLDVVEEEATEDLTRMAGTTEDDVHEDSVLRVTWLRLPWLLIGLGGGIGSALLMGRFEAQLSQVIALAFFVPVIMAMGGSVGIQCSTVVVRAIALGELDPKRVGERVAREFFVSLIMALILSLLLAAVAFVLEGSWGLCLILGIALFLSILVAASAGTMIPIVLRRMGFDPALATGPFITTTNDVLNLLIYFVVAAKLIGRI